ncbi:hypothetical protein FHW12_000578 [Dokdonella fugitiva]|uniref:Uncharacterized protein n=1 Tax=Dokdonella fugitiva TaxID=328517 RepID=A0A839EPY8_9GAMM|nr:hypothetical protein [Dokdonella fugitiva]MBA8886387.1 hypothetical protein [Dokdonella fugitiva]
MYPRSLGDAAEMLDAIEHRPEENDAASMGPGSPPLRTTTRSTMAG